MRRITCPSDLTLVAFSLGDLEEEVLDSVREHQEHCPTCEMKARLLEDRTDSVIVNLRRVAQKDATSREEEGGDQGNCARLPSLRSRDEVGGNVYPVLLDYEVEDFPLGAGSMGVVYKARHLQLDRVVALKMIAGRSSQISALFQIEAKAVAQLQHPNIVQIFELGHYEGQPFLALEFVEGGPLERQIAGRPLPFRQAAELVRTLALAADYAHRQGIVHCDLKPSNILITSDGVPKITDFGVAKWMKSDNGWRQPGDVVGTPRYMAPEQASGRVEAVGPTADIYSLGVLLYEMLTGLTPYHPANSLETLSHLREREPRSPRWLRPNLPRDLETVVLKCLRKEPARRYPDAKALADDLGRFLAGEPIQARPTGWMERTLYWVRRRPIRVTLLAVILLWLATLGHFHRRYDALTRKFDADLKNATLAEPSAMAGSQPVLVSQNDDGSVRLRAFAAALYGESVVLEARYGNIGFWNLANDRAVWTFRIDRPTTFALALDYSNANLLKGNVFQIDVGGRTFRSEPISTGAWSKFQSFPVGDLTLSAGIHRLEIRPSGTLRGALFDLRTVMLTPL